MTLDDVDNRNEIRIINIISNLFKLKTPKDPFENY